MSHTCGTPSVNHFSNPDVIVLDKPTGTATEDNARAIEDNMVSSGGPCISTRSSVLGTLPTKNPSRLLR